MNILFRADDAGSTKGANRAIVETVRHGVVRNISIMVPGPAFDHAVPLLKELENVDLGLHVTLSSEWNQTPLPPGGSSWGKGPGDGGQAVVRSSQVALSDGAPWSEVRAEGGTEGEGVQIASVKVQFDSKGQGVNRDDRRLTLPPTKWGPISHPSQVPTLVEPDGYFTQNPGVLQERGFSLDEAMAEVAAQLATARAAGLRIDYLDQHMGVGWIDGLQARLDEFAEREGLVTGRFAYFPGPLPETIETLIDKLTALGTPHLFVTHPGSDDDPVMAQFLHPGLQPGQIHAERTADRRLLTHSTLLHAIQEGRLHSRTYREMAV